MHADSSSPSYIYRVKIQGAIHEGTYSILEKACKDIEQEKAWGLLIEMDTPGGTLEATRKIVKLMLGSSFPIIVYVSPSGSRAGSAGTFITLAAYIAAMAPGTNIGAAHPVTVTGKDPEAESGKHMGEKIENDTLAFVSSIAQIRNRNVEWAKDSVKNSASITSEEALRLDVIDIVSKDTAQLLRDIHGRSIKLGDKMTVLDTSNLQIKDLELSWKMKFFNFIAHPTLVFAFLAIAGLGFYLEFSHPGLIFPSVIGGVSLIFFLIASSLIPLNSLGIFLMILAFACFIAEVFVVSFGLLTIAGAALLTLGGIFLFDASSSDFSIPVHFLISISIGCSLVGLIIAYALGKTFSIKQQTGNEVMIGARAKVIQSIGPHQGKIFLMGEFWEARSKEAIEEGQEVEILSINHLIAEVKQVSSS
ncbi:MAG: nodulation protein NfeD [Bdellovibrionales bacterium]|nr:nodulation protein NfeD [Bdellovibrionales bacterium]